ncbi:MAG: hypothetical protein ACT4PV_00415 [Planctomycetaceae bacterium]
MKGWLVTVVALLAGGAAGYLLGAGRETVARSSRSAPDGRAPEFQPPPRQQPSSDLGEALRALPTPAPVRGTGSISVRVRGADGAGIPGATVRATPVSRGDGGGARRGDGPPSPVALEEAVRLFVARELRARAGLVEAVTGADGGCRLEALADAGYSVTAYLAGYEVVPSPGQRVGDVRPGASLEFTATEVVELPVEVFGLDGERIERVLIRWSRGSSGESGTTWWTASRPSVALPPGHYTLSAQGQDEEALTSDSESVELRAGGGAGGVVLRLRDRPGIRGVVTFREGVRPRHLTLYCVPGSEDGPAGDKRLVEKGAQHHALDRQGYSYTLRDLSPGTYRVGVAIQRALLATRTVVVGSGTARCDLEVEAIDPAAYVLVRVLGPDGEPVTDVEFDTAYRTETSSSSGGGTFLRREDGAFLVFHHDSSGSDPGGEHFVEAGSARYGRKELSYRRGSVKELELRFGPPATLELTVAGLAGSRFETAVTFSLAAAGREAEDRPRGSREGSKPQETGRLLLGPVEAGEYDLVSRAGVDRHSSLEAGRQRLRLLPGVNKLSVAMPRLHSLTVSVPDLEQGARLSLRLERDNGAWVQQILGEDRRALFEPLPDGRYQLQAQRGKVSGAMTVTLPGPAEVVYQPREMNAMRVTITEALGALAEQGLRDGDLIVAAGGTEFESGMQMQLALMGALGKDEATLTVLRGGRRIDVTLRGKALMARADAMGGRLDPVAR